VGCGGSGVSTGLFDWVQCPPYDAPTPGAPGLKGGTQAKKNFICPHLIHILWLKYAGKDMKIAFRVEFIKVKNYSALKKYVDAPGQVQTQQRTLRFSFPCGSLLRPVYWERVVD
jgi:hypothetical protein